MTLLTFFAFLSGIVTILSPCILPVLPIILSGTVGGKSKPFGIVVGFIASFSLFTLALSALVQTFSISADTLRMAAVIIIVTFGLTLTISKLQMQLEKALSGLVRTRGATKRSGFSGGFLTGVSLGIVWTPCVGPIMASVISLAVSRQVDGGAVIIVAAYSLGTALPMFAIMAGGRKLLNRFPKLSTRTASIQRFFGIIMIAAGLMIGTGADRRFQTLILDVFPNYGTGLTTFEQGESVRDALDERKNKGDEENQFTWEGQPEDARLGDFGEAPPLIAKGPWINTEAPLSMEHLRGKVVLIDFWTYSCINCIRTIPYLRDWYGKYADEGLEIIGVHSPEFPFERNIANVREAVEDLQIDWPVVLDNDFAQWESYNNRYWPAHFFIDSNGIIRYFHFGEGSYEESERVIRKLLEEAGSQLNTAAADDSEEILMRSHTPEIYLGYKRAEGFTSEGMEPDQLKSYKPAEKLSPGEWSLEGEWVIRNDFIEIDGTGRLELKYESKDLFIVIEPLDEQSLISVEIDGKRPEDTADVNMGILKPLESRLYHLASFSKADEHTLDLGIEGRIRLYTFTFG